MYPRLPVPPELGRLAEQQGGVATREQAVGLGFSRHALARLISSGQTIRIADGIFSLGAAEPTWDGWAWAAVLAGGDDARLGGHAAAFGHRLVDEPPGDILVLVPAGAWRSRRRPTGPFGWTFQREAPGTRDRRSFGNPPRISVEDTVLDLTDTATVDEAVGWITAAIQRRLTTPARIRSAVRRRQRLRHRRLIEQLLVETADGVHSPLEHRYLHRVERAHQLPVGRRQARNRSTFTDVFYEDYGLIVELDGKIGHLGSGRFRDMRRDNASTTQGLATLRYGWSDVSTRSCLVASQVARNLELRGWPGLPSRCPACTQEDLAG